MTMAGWSRTRPMRLALAALGAALAVLLWTVVRAFHAEPLPDAPPTAVASLGAMRRRVAVPADVQAAVENDLFASDRSAPSSPYRMPGETGAADDKPAVEPMKPNVLGTVVATDGRSFATLQLGDQSPTLVHVGDRIGEWVVKGITRGRVVLVSGGGSRAELTVSKPGT